jgi:putative transposase
MPRPLRPIDDGLIYHVINRGNNRQRVFHKPRDFQAFLDALAHLKERQPFKLYGYCLMSNHIHLLIRPQATSISRIVQSLLVSHTLRYHQHHKSGGHVWQGRFKSPVIQDDEHLLTVLRYIEANPLRAKIVKQAGDYPWSSYPFHGLGMANPLIDSLTTYDELAVHTKTRQRKWSEMIHAPLDERVMQAVRRANETGLPFGDPRWIERLANRLGLDLKIRPRGRPKKTLGDNE